MPALRWLPILVGAIAVVFAGHSLRDSTPATASDSTHLREQVIELMVPGPDGPQYGRITMFAIDDPGMDMGARLAEGRATMLARFPGAIEIVDGDVSAQFRLFEKPVRWAETGTSWFYNSTNSTAAMDPKTALESVIAGAEGWNNAGGSGWHFDYLGETTTPTGCNGDTASYAKDGKNVVGWGHIVGGYWGYSCHWASASLVANTPYFAMTEFDIVFEPGISYDAATLRALALHEFGHSLGLNHTEPGLCPGQAMCGGNGAVTFISPRPDDINGVIALYGVAPVTPTSGPAATPTPTVPSVPRPFKARALGLARD